MKTVYDLMAATATALAGKPVTVRLQAPSTKGNHGECHAGPDGRLILDIHPGLDESQTLLVVCHEAAHARLHRFAPSTVYRAAPGTLVPNPNTLGERVRETQAETLANEWIEYGRKHADPTLGDLEGPLWALLDYYRR